MYPDGHYPLPPPPQPRVPSPRPTFWFSTLFSLFGLIPASRDAKAAEEQGQPTGPYWVAFVGGVLANALLVVGIFAFFYLGVFGAWSDNDNAKTDTEVAADASESSSSPPATTSAAPSYESASPPTATTAQSPTYSPPAGGAPTSTGQYGEPEPAEQTYSATEGQVISLVTVGDAHLRALPDKNSASLLVIPTGASLTGLDIGGWIKVSYQGQTGYVSLAAARGEFAEPTSGGGGDAGTFVDVVISYPAFVGSAYTTTELESYGMSACDSLINGGTYEETAASLTTTTPLTYDQALAVAQVADVYLC
ncbi:hypothetical protein EK0264_14705 [Epidermidibacterium keratini]|uniref:SH3 domain-containing protein n=1 Tax=Epidermidibacterium keratini TaxID=1891644 RepID=A0A7L4YQI1_9ACTN|nr:hypothetical protein [Epidermidibacterium keratini]QHC01416.1 hypothetical protein EK0264_14705 [Epidermidibacterium keratini]